MNKQEENKKWKKLRELNIRNAIKSKLTGEPTKHMSCQDMANNTGLNVKEIESTLHSALSKLAKAGISEKDLEGLTVDYIIKGKKI